MKHSSNGGSDMKKWLAALKYIKPGDMEDFLESSSREGIHLKMIGQAGLFYFEFEEGEPRKYRYVVDISALPKALYLQTLIEEGWEYMGKTGNCYVWRMEYEEKRPKSFADKICLRKHCNRLAIVALLAMLLCLGAAGALIYSAVLEYRYYDGYTVRFIMYLVEALINLPLAVYFFWAGGKLLS